MSDRFVEAFVDKLVLLEQKAGTKVHYHIMSPIDNPLHDSLALQTIAKQIAEFIELKGFTFIIATAKQKEKTAGHIDLSTRGGDVFIELDNEMIKFPDAVAATLCHEVCHKWLQVNGIRASIEIDHEILTDITCIFLGFGKIMLNGCITANVNHETIPGGTETMTSGYLDRDQLAFVYRLVCAMRNIPSSVFMLGLNTEAAFAVQNCDLAYGHHYALRFHKTETTYETVERFKSKYVGLQFTLANLEKQANYIKKSFCEIIDDFLAAAHKKLISSHKNVIAMTQEIEPDPALRFLQAIQTELKIGKLTDEIKLMSQETTNFFEHAKFVGRHLFRNSHRFPPPSPMMFNIVTCSQDGTKIRLPLNSGNLIVTCPVCKYRFAYNTNVLSFPALPAQQKSFWWQRLQNLFKKIRV